MKRALAYFVILLAATLISHAQMKPDKLPPLITDAIAGPPVMLQVAGVVPPVAETCNIYQSAAESQNSQRPLASASTNAFLGLWINADATEPCICKVSFKIKTEAGTAPDFHAKISKSNNSTYAIGDLIGTSATVLGTAIGATFSYHDFVFSPCVTMDGSTGDYYTITVSRTDDSYDGSNYVRLAWTDGTDDDSGYSFWGEWTDAKADNDVKSGSDFHYKLYKE